jgi:citrate_citG: triphosphoribosyl-dephospho-CoA synthase CitG
MTEKLLRGYAEEMLSEAAYMSLLDELYTTPKPGLVDKNNNGAHSDMNVSLFVKKCGSHQTVF